MPNGWKETARNSGVFTLAVDNVTDWELNSRVIHFDPNTPPPSDGTVENWVANMGPVVAYADCNNRRVWFNRGGILTPWMPVEQILLQK